MSTIYLKKEIKETEEYIQFFISDIPIEHLQQEEESQPPVDYTPPDEEPFMPTPVDMIPQPQGLPDDEKLSEMASLLNMPTNTYAPPPQVQALFDLYIPTKQSPQNVLGFQDALITAKPFLMDNAHKQWLLNEIRTVAQGDAVDEFLVSLIAKEIQ